MTVTAWFDVSAPGSVSLSKRGELAADGTCGYRDVLEDQPVEAVECTLALGEDQPGLVLGLTAWHVEDPHGNAWHPALRILLRREDAARLRDFLTFALAGET